MEQNVQKDIKRQESQKIRKEQNMKTSSKGLRGWWGQYYVYVVSSLFIIVTMLVVMIFKGLWPFGGSTPFNGDYIIQAIPFISELKNKFINGESLLYTWNAGYGTNFYSIIAYLMINPFTLFYMLIPTGAILKMSIFIYILNLILCNCTMLYFLSHRPLHSLPKNKVVNMLFSLSYALCVYMVSNINNWGFLACVTLFPLIVLGLENFVANKGWKLYFVTLAAAFVCNYYIAGLFSIFIILYYLTLEFENFKGFLNKSLKILGMSIIAVLISSVILVPTAIQMMRQSYTVSSYEDGVWFTTFFDIIKYFFIFNSSIGAGTELDSYGEVNLYYGLLLLMLTTFYFVNSKIKRTVRLKKLCLAIIYIVAFNLNGLNYIMHLMHYPTGFPNRFSLCFTLLCIILAYEAWVSMERTDFKHVTIGRGVAVGLGWAIVTVLCFAFAETVQYQFTYSYSIMIFLFYMVAILLLPFLKGKVGKVLAVIGCVELCLNLALVFTLRISYTYVEDFGKEIESLQTFLAESQIREDDQFSRTIGGKINVVHVNEGMVFNMKGTTLFSSSIGDYKAFLGCMGIGTGTNNIRTFTYNQASMSLLNVKYVYQDNSLVETTNMPDVFYTSAADVMERYDVVYQQGKYALYENPTVLSLGYMIDGQADELFPEGLAVPYERNDNIGQLLNEWIEGISGSSNVMEPVPLMLNSMAAANCNAAVFDNFFLLTDGERSFDSYGVDDNIPNLFKSEELGDYDPTENSVIRFDCTVEEEGEYFAEILGLLTPMGHMEAGEEVSVFYEVPPYYVMRTGAVGSTVHIYRFNEEQWQKTYDTLSQQQLEIENYTSTSVDGTIQVKEEGIFFTSIPYDKNWHLYIDGEETEILPLWENSFVAARLEPGEHTVRLKYRQRGLLLGGIISVIALGLSIFAFWYSKKRDYLLEEGMSEEHLETFYSEEILDNRKRMKSSKAHQETSSNEISGDEMSVDEAQSDESN